MELWLFVGEFGAVSAVFLGFVVLVVLGFAGRGWFGYSWFAF